MAEAELPRQSIPSWAWFENEQAKADLHHIMITDCKQVNFCLCTTFLFLLVYTFVPIAEQQMEMPPEIHPFL